MPDHAVLVLPESKEKRQLPSFIDKIKLIFIRAVSGNNAGPFLFEKHEIQFQDYFVASPAAVKSQQANFRKRGAEF